MNNTKRMLCVLLAGMTTMAGAVEPIGAPTREAALMLYFAKSFGSTQRQNRTPLQFGLKLQQSSPFVANRAVALLDARYSLGGAKTLTLAGGLSFGDDSDEADGSSSGSSRVAQMHPGWTLAAVIAALAVGACATKTGLCEDDDGYGETSPETTDGRVGNGA